MLKLSKKEKKVVKKVIEDLQNNIEMFSGHYCGHGKSCYFVQGIGIAMEMFGAYVDEDYSNKLQDNFVDNMIKSETEYQLKLYEKSKDKFS